jgi:hypothetical protein
MPDMIHGNRRRVRKTDYDAIAAAHTVSQALWRRAKYISVTIDKGAESKHNEQ